MSDPVDPGPSLEPFIADALRVAAPAIVFETSRRVAALHPGRVVETVDWRFDVDAFAAASRCAVRPSAGLHARRLTRFDGAGEPLCEKIESGWIDVEWEGRRLTVLRMDWHADGESHEVSFIAGAERAAAEAFFRAVCAWNAEVRPAEEVLVFQGGRFRKSASLREAIRRASFDELVLPPSLRVELRADFARFFEARQLYQRYGVAWRRGVLFTGPPGNGKTHTIKALVNAVGKPCLYVRSFENPCSGEQASIREVFARARDTAPCVLVLEDLDALVNDKNRSFFLNELDGFARNEGVVTIATTNHPERLDPAIAERPSRFDRRYRFELPDAALRAAYLALFCRPLEPEMRPTDAGLSRIAERTEGFSYAYLKELGVSAMIRWMDEMRPDAMDAVMDTEAEALRAQMASARA